MSALAKTGPKNLWAEKIAPTKLDISVASKLSEGLSLIWMGRILGRSDASRKDKAEQYILKGINILEKVELKPFYTLGRFFLGEFYLDAGQREKAAKNLKKADSMFQEMGMDYWLARTREVMQRL